jgi:hypothetical protein
MRKNIEIGTVSKQCPILFKNLVFRLYVLRFSFTTAKILYLGDLLLSNFTDVVIISDALIQTGLIIPVKYKAMDTIVITEVFLIAFFKADILKDQQHCHHANRQTNNINAV